MKKSKKRLKKLLRRAEIAAARRAIGDKIKAFDAFREKMHPLVDELKELVRVHDPSNLGTASLHGLLASRLIIGAFNDQLILEKKMYGKREKRTKR